MGYTIRLKGDEDYSDVVFPSPTYSLSEIFDWCLTGEELPGIDTGEIEVFFAAMKTPRFRGLRVLDGLKAGHTAPCLKKALERSYKDEDRLQLMEPSNGWGFIYIVRRVFGRMISIAEEYPDAVWSIS